MRCDKCRGDNMQQTARQDYCPDCGYCFYYGHAGQPSGESSYVEPEDYEEPPEHIKNDRINVPKGHPRYVAYCGDPLGCRSKTETEALYAIKVNPDAFRDGICTQCLRKLAEAIQQLI